MPVFQATTEKYMAAFGEYWVNTYHVNAADLPAALIVANALGDAELPLYTNAITLTKCHVRDINPATDAFRTSVRNLAGTRSTTGLTSSVVLFVVGRVDFSVLDNGRPCRKYIRGLYEEDLAGMSLSSGMQTLLNNYAAAAAAQPICDPSGADITTGSAAINIAMRQLRRGSKKKTTP